MFVMIIPIWDGLGAINKYSTNENKYFPNKHLFVASNTVSTVYFNPLLHTTGKLYVFEALLILYHKIINDSFYSNDKRYFLVGLFY